jgi:hypothetical protein
MQRFWLVTALLLVAAVVGLLLESGSVQHVESDAVHGGRPDTLALQRQPYAEQSRPVTSSQASRLAVGERFASFDELVGDQQAAGYVKVGAFGKFWPATVSEITTDRDEIKFIRQDGTPHHYTKFDGYDMKMVRLMAGDKETIVVFRSLKKR